MFLSNVVSLENNQDETIDTYRQHETMYLCRQLQSNWVEFIWVCVLFIDFSKGFSTFFSLETIGRASNTIQSKVTDGST